MHHAQAYTASFKHTLDLSSPSHGVEVCIHADEFPGNIHPDGVPASSY